LTAWTIAESGDLVDRRVWADLGPGSAPDGICADASGAIWYASVPGQCCKRVAEGGEVLETVDADRGCFACMLGGEDGRTLYVVANRYGDGSASDGVVLTHRAAVPRAGRP
jgi:sugar lactone lactonase YvrE